MLSSGQRLNRQMLKGNQSDQGVSPGSLPNLSQQYLAARRVTGARAHAEESKIRLASLCSATTMSTSMEYLQSEANPVLAPLIKKLLAERPHGNAAIREAIMRLASEIGGSLSELNMEDRYCPDRKVALPSLDLEILPLPPARLAHGRIVYSKYESTANPNLQRAREPPRGSEGIHAALTAEASPPRKASPPR
jgi:hypothetical protein